VPAPIPEPGPDEEQQSAPGWAWVEGSAGTGPVPGYARPGPQPEPPGADGLPAGLCAATAAADPKIGLRAGGRPARVSRDALGQIENALLLAGAPTRASHRPTGPRPGCASS
jgi:hypothetical protein